MRTVMGTLLVLLLASAASGVECTVECPEGYLGICVETDGECSCRCAKDASSGSDDLLALLRTKGASKDAIERATQAYKEMVGRGLTDFSFEITDSGHTYTVVSSENTDDTRFKR